MNYLQLSLNSSNLLNFQALLTLNENTVLLNNGGRRKICNLIVRGELKRNPEKPISNEQLLNFAQEITTIFTKEHISSYFISYISYDKFLT